MHARLRTGARRAARDAADDSDAAAPDTHLFRDLAAISRLERGTIDTPTLDLLRLLDNVISQIFYHACLLIAQPCLLILCMKLWELPG
jgi:hypothetical protein